MVVGSRRQVMNGTADKTSGGLTKKDLVLNKWGRIVSRKARRSARKTFRKNLGDKRAAPFGSERRSQRRRK